MKPVYVRGLGFWTPGYASPEAWCRGEPDPSVDAPEVALLSGPLRRRATGLTRVAVEVLDQAARTAGCDVTTVPIVWATAHGEHTTAIKILGMMHSGEGKLSPTHFHNSVHNTASGYASIATGQLRAVHDHSQEARNSWPRPSWRRSVTSKPRRKTWWWCSQTNRCCRPSSRSEGTAPLALAFCLSSRSVGAGAVLTDFRRDAVAPVKHCDRFGPLYVGGGLSAAGADRASSTGYRGARSWSASAPAPSSCVDLELVGA